MKKLLIFLIAIILVNATETANAQGVRDSYGKIRNSYGDSKGTDYKGMTIPKNSPQNKSMRKAIKVKTVKEIIVQNAANISSIAILKDNVKGSSDEKLYREVVRRHSWLEGWGEPITKETAKHLPYYYRFSLKNAAGHWLLVEALHGDTLTSNHPLGTYILNKKNDTDTENEGWRQQLQRVGWWLFVSDLSGENVIEERAYEAKRVDADLIYTSQIVRNDDKHVTISYNDSWGQPADMNESADYTYGSVVQITYNECGLDSIIDYLDGAGFRKDNINGVGQERLYYDEHMRLIEHTSNNIVGDMAIDNWGNCGYRKTYDDKDNTYTITFIDNYGNPMRMPAQRVQGNATYIRCKVKRDKWGRDSEVIILDENNENDATLDGTHRVVYEYSDDGTLLSTHYYDLADKTLLRFK